MMNFYLSVESLPWKSLGDIKSLFLVQVILWLPVARWITFRTPATVKFLPDLALSAILRLTPCQFQYMMKGDRGILSALWRLILEWEGLTEEL